MKLSNETLCHCRTQLKDTAPTNPAPLELSGPEAQAMGHPYLAHGGGVHRGEGDFLTRPMKSVRVQILLLAALICLVTGWIVITSTRANARRTDAAIASRVR